MVTTAPEGVRTVSGGASNQSEETDVRWMVGLGLAALALRLWFVLSVGQTKMPFNDAGIYDAIARNLASGHGFRGLYGQLTAQWPPVYPYLLSLVYRAFGANATSGEVLNAVLSAATVPVLYFCALRALGRREAIVVGVGMTLLVGQVLWTDVLLSESLAVFVLAVLLALLAVMRPERTGSAVLAGALIGLAALTRGEGFVLLAVPIAMWWPEIPRRLLARQTAVMVAMVLVFVIPWTIRNAMAMHAFVPVSTNFASTFWAGHNPKATGSVTFPPDSLLQSVTAPPTSPKHELQVSSVLRRKAFSWMVSHPLDELRLIPLKVLAMISPDGAAVGVWINVQQAPGRPVLSKATGYRLVLLADAGWYALLTLFLASLVVYGKALWRRRRILRGALSYCAISLVVYGFVFYGGSRYHASMEPLMLLVAAPLVIRLGTLRAQRLH